MSNVLIGIIGVILFIGLALAGALFLGPRFQESTNNSRASAAVQMVSQVANAANLYRVQEGRDLADGLVDSGNALITGTYMKAFGQDPNMGGLPVVQAISSVRYATMTLGTNGEAVCRAINKQTRNAAANETVPSGPTGSTGCFTSGGLYAVYAAI
jgi:hypothetical protein